MARILIAEDDVHMLRILSIWLRRNGHDVCEACDGMVAKQQLESDSFDLVVSDVNMPRMSGVELAHWLREESGVNVPMIILSSRCDQQCIADDMAPLGIAVHPKPFSPSRLVAAIEKGLGDCGVGQPVVRCVEKTTSKGTTGDG